MKVTDSLYFNCFMTTPHWRCPTMGWSRRNYLMYICQMRLGWLLLLLVCFHWWTLPLPCSTIHCCPLLLSDGIRRHHPYIQFGEIEITLDDVSFLFHPPLAGNFFTASVINQELACITVEQFLGVTLVTVLEELKANKGAHFYLSWLWDTY